MVNFVESTVAGSRQVTPADLDAAFAAKADLSALQAEVARATAAELQMQGGAGGTVTAASITAALRSAELVAGSAATGGQIRLTAGASTGPSAMLRYDGASFYLLDSATSTGTFTTHRPFAWNLATGAVTLGGSGEQVTVGGPLQARGGAVVGYTGSQSVVPTGNPTLATTHGLNVQGTAVYNDRREFLGCFGLTSSVGDVVAHPSTVNDKVALYAGMEGNAGSGDCWSINSVMNVMAGGNNIAAQGYELDFNNLSNDKSQDLNHPAYGLAITTASQFQNTAAMMVSDFNNSRWTRGIYFVNNSVRDVAILDTTASQIVLKAIGGHAIGVDFSTASFSNQAIKLAAGVGGLVSWTAAGSTVSDNVDANLNRTIGLGAAGVFHGGQTLSPLTDNTASLGNPQSRYSAVYAVNGVIQTSDVTQKTNIQPLPDMLAVVNTINPIRYNWAVGGHKTVKVRRRQMVPAMAPVTTERVVHEVVDGKVVSRTVTETRDEPILDEMPVHDELGNPVFDYIAADLHKVERNNPRVHFVPRMVEQEVEVEEAQPVEGKRTHWGFAAQEVRAAIEAHGLGDFGGHVVSEDGLHGLRMDQMIPILWRAVQELSAQVKDLTRP
jgi:hypothetical protein